MTYVGDIAEQVRGVTYSKEEVRLTATPHYIPLLRANNIDNGILSFDELVYVPQNRVSDRQFLMRGDVVIATSSGSISVVGKAAPFKADNFYGSFGAFCKVLRPKADIVDPSFFSHFFQTKSYRQKISALAAGANINNLKNEHLDNFDISLPSLSEQRRIATILDKADALHRKRKQALELLDNLVRSLFSEMFGDADQNYKRLPVVALGEIVIEGPSNGLYKPASAYGRGTPILRINNFYAGEIVDLRDLRRLDLEDNEIVRFELHKDDIVINRVNSREYVGKSAIIPALNERTVYESNMMRLRVDSDAALPHFIIQSLQSGAIRRQIISKTKEAINQASINQKDVCSLQIVLPTVKDQKLFVKAAEHISALRATQREEEMNGQALFASLQHRAFTGQL